ARVHHPDVAGADTAATRTATRKMAEINRAYEQLQVGTPGRRDDGDDDGPGAGPPQRRTTWPPKPRPTRPVTGRLDTTETFRPRNMTTGAAPFPSRPHAHPHAP